MDKVIVGMSGGIDSSVAALLLKNQGYDVIGVTLKHLGESERETNTKTCCSLDDIYDAKRACQIIGIPHYVIDAVEEFKKEVIDYFIESYNKGITPSPCIICDEKIKIKKLIELADKVGAKYISTGHYSKVEYSCEFNQRLLKKAKSINKDQTYMLYRLGEKTLERMLFPLAEFEKEKVREIAKENGIETYNKKDSQGICFAPEGYIEFLKSQLGDKIEKGKFLDKNNNEVGEHEGYQIYTIGQRRGLKLKKPEPYFITNIKPKENEIILGTFEELKREKIEIINTKFLVTLTNLMDKKLIAKARFSSKGLEGSIKEEDGKVYFVYDEKNAEVAKGQHVVLYYEDYVVGGGEISF